MTDTKDKSVTYDETDAARGIGRDVRFSESRIGRFQDRLKDAIGSESVRSFSLRSGVSQTALREYLKGKSEPGLEALVKIADTADVSVLWLATGEGATRRQPPLPEPPTDIQEQIVRAFRQFEAFNPGSTPRFRRELFARYWNERQFGPRGLSEEWVSPDLVREVPDLTAEQIEAWDRALMETKAAKARAERRQAFDETHGIPPQPGINEDRRALYKGVSPEDFVFVARYDAEVSAGHGAFLEEDQVRDRLAFKRSWIREMGLQPDKLALVTVKGDSMEPNLFHGDIVLVDLSTPGITVDGIYVLRTDDGLVVKRLQRMITGDIYIKSDNPAYEVQTVPHDRLDQVRILGRAVWLGRHL
jgi:phage repressor protein C with HTH and peptisase S24 domain/transcriptional regulator with XRE-family HTH domain